MTPTTTRGDDEREPVSLSYAWATWVDCPACGGPDCIPPRCCIACGGSGKVMALDAITWRARLGLA